MRRNLVAVVSTMCAATGCVTVVAPGLDPDHDPANPRAPTVAFVPIPDPLMDGGDAAPAATPEPAADPGMAGHSMHGGH